jgi:glutamyl-tRNA(Gln) amidotransferase subunit D
MDGINERKRKNVAILGTGGTIASYVDYETGAVRPLNDAQEILYAQPELAELAEIETEIVFNIFSEDMERSNWVVLAKKVYDKIRKGTGVVVTHGTDTLSFTSSALSFLIENPKAPVVFTASQRSSDRPSSDAFFNLLGAVKVASSDFGQVVVVMHEGISDDILAIHSGVRLRKMHTSRRDAFKSVNSDILGRINRNLDIEWSNLRKVGEQPMKLYERVNEKVALLYFYPGMQLEILEHTLELNDGLIIAGTGLGHISNRFLGVLRNSISEGKVVGMTSQCLYGSVNLNVYSTGRNLLNVGVIPLGDMLPEVAYTKLSFLMGNFKTDEVKKLLVENLRGELSARRRS